MRRCGPLTPPAARSWRCRAPPLLLRAHAHTPSILTRIVHVMLVCSLPTWTSRASRGFLYNTSTLVSASIRVQRSPALSHALRRAERDEETPAERANKELLAVKTKNVAKMVGRNLALGAVTGAPGIIFGVAGILGAVCARSPSRSSSYPSPRIDLVHPV